MLHCSELCGKLIDISKGLYILSPFYLYDFLM